MLVSPFNARVDVISEQSKYTTLYLTALSDGYINSPAEGTLRVIERGWDTICSINSDQGNIVIIRHRKTKNLGSCTWIPRQIKIGESIGLSIAPLAYIELRIPNNGLVLTCSHGNRLYDRSLLGVYLEKYKN